MKQGEPCLPGFSATKETGDQQRVEVNPQFSAFYRDQAAS